MLANTSYAYRSCLGCDAGAAAEQTLVVEGQTAIQVDLADLCAQSQGVECSVTMQAIM